MKVELNQGELGLLMRSLLRSLEKTPDKEKPAHEALYAKLGAAHVEGMDPELRAAVGRAIDAQIGR